MSVVKINAITVPHERFGEFEQRFAGRAGKVEEAAGFEGFELLRPNDAREVCLVVTRWRSEEDFQGWLASREGVRSKVRPLYSVDQIWPFQPTASFKTGPLVLKT
jgi:heme-degrading monooxygenase HmoA